LDVERIGEEYYERWESEGLNRIDQLKEQNFIHVVERIFDHCIAFIQQKRMMVMILENNVTPQAAIQAEEDG